MAAALSGTYETTMEADCSAEKLWDVIKNSTEVMPKIFPSEIKSIEVIEGDGKSAGTVRKILFAEEIPRVSVEKFVSVDDGSKTMKVSNIDGEIMKFFKIFNSTLSLTSSGSDAAAGPCNLKWSVEYEKQNEDGSTPEVVWERAKKHLEAFAAYSRTITS